MTAASTLRKQLDHLARLIDSPRTGDGERDAAVRARARIAARLAEAKPEEHARWEPWFKGDKYEATQGIPANGQLTKLIREDLKLAVKTARAAAGPGAVAVADPFASMPETIRFSVTTPHYGSVRVKVTGIPEEWGYRTVRDCPYPGENRVVREALARLSEAVHDIANAYNYDNSDIQTDYFCKRYYLSVTDGNGHGLPQAMSYHYEEH